MSENVEVMRSRSRAVRRDDGARRVELLDGLLALFVEEGFSTLTVDEMCRRLRCSKTTLYGVAGSREQIVRAVVRHFWTRVTAQIDAEVQDEPDLSRRLVRYLEAIGSAVEGASMHFYDDLVRYEPSAEVYLEGQRQGVSRLEKIVDDAVAAGVYRPVDPRLVAQVVANLIAGVEVGSIGAGSARPTAALLGELGDLLARGLAP